jgi:sulfatase maturation enzyme AslB (radical SAM superfamily)
LASGLAPPADILAVMENPDFMILSNLTFILTDQCNFTCTYCFQKRLNPITIGSKDVIKSIDLLYPFLAENSYINFYGGEPLLAYDSIREILRYMGEKNKKLDQKGITLTLTTNGSLLDEKKIEFLNRHRFQVMVSFDGPAHEINRRPGNFDLILANIKKLQTRPNIHLELNSVFAPNSLHLMAESIIHNIGLSVPHIHLSVDKTRPWTPQDLATYQQQLSLLKEYLVDYYQVNQTIPVKTFLAKPNTGPFWCAGGTNQLALAPDGLLWGCHLFHDYFTGRKDHPEFSKYCFGHIDDFAVRHKKTYPEILVNYRNLKQQSFWCTGRICALCEDLEACRVCPMDAAFSGSIIGHVPDWSCQINQIRIRERRDFFSRIEALNPNGISETLTPC